MSYDKPEWAHPVGFQPALRSGSQWRSYTQDTQGKAGLFQSENCMGERLFGRWEENLQVEKYLSDKSHISKTYKEFSEVNRKTIQF